MSNENQMVTASDVLILWSERVMDEPPVRKTVGGLPHQVPVQPDYCDEVVSS
jgi:hypothetical protein